MVHQKPYEKGKAPSGPKKLHKDHQNAVYRETKKDHHKGTLQNPWKWNTFNKRYEKIQKTEKFDKSKWATDWNVDSSDSSPVLHVWLELPWWARGLLIGKDGRELKEIRDKSNVQRGYLPPDRYAIYLKGTRASINIAEQEVYKILKDVKKRIDVKQKRNNMQFDAYVCPANWRVRDHIDLSPPLQASIFTIQRWTATKVNQEDDEPEWEESPDDKQTLIMVRCDRNEMPQIYSALMPGVDLVMKVPKNLAENILTSQDKLFDQILTKIGIIEFQCPPGTSECPHKMFKWKGTYAAIHEIARLFHQLIKDTQVKAENSNSRETYRVVELPPALHSYLSQPGNMVIREIERRFDTKLAFVEKHFCYGQGWATENTRTSLLVISGVYQTTMFAETQIIELIRESARWSNNYLPSADAAMWEAAWAGQQAAGKFELETMNALNMSGASGTSPLASASFFGAAAAGASPYQLPAFVPGMANPYAASMTAEQIQQVSAYIDQVTAHQAASSAYEAFTGSFLPQYGPTSGIRGSRAAGSGSPPALSSSWSATPWNYSHA